MYSSGIEFALQTDAIYKNIVIFGLKTLLHALCKYTGIKIELYQTNIKSEGLSLELVPTQVELINACSKRLISNKKMHNHSIICTR